MSKIADITYHENKIIISGDLCFDNVMPVFVKSLAIIEKCTELHFDFAELHTSDSSGLALIIEWIKIANDEDKPILFVNLSSDLQSLIEAAGLEEIIPSMA